MIFCEEGDLKASISLYIVWRLKPMKVRLPFRHNTIIYATPCNSDGTVTLRAEGGFGGIGGPSPGDGGGLEACDVEASSSAFVTSNIPI